MRGIDRDGRPVEHRRRGPARAAPPGPLARGPLADLRRLLTRGLKRAGYSVEQIAQVVRTSRRTAIRDLAEPAGNDDHDASPGETS